MIEIVTKERLLVELKKCADNPDSETAHGDADSWLLDYINDDEIREAYNKIEKWYA